MATKLLKMVKSVIVDTMMKNVMTNVVIRDKFLKERNLATCQLKVVLVEHKPNAGM